MQAELSGSGWLSIRALRGVLWTDPAMNCTQNCSFHTTDYLDYDITHLMNLFSLPTLTVVTTICVLLALVGISGNLMTILIVLKFKDMRTTTNFYLSSMALSDLFIFLCMPLDLYHMWRERPWIFGDLLCRLFQFVSESCTYSTILSITALSVERYFAICFPLKAKMVITKGRVKVVIFFLWSLAFACAGPIFVLVGVEYENGTDPLLTSECKPTEYAHKSGLLNIMVWVSTSFFFLPVFCLSIFYSLIGRKLWRRRRADITPNVSHREKNHKQTVKMLAVVIFAFVLCWLPFHVGRYLFSKASEEWSEQLYQVSQYCNLVSCVLFYLSAAINPILYNIMSKKYRVAAFKLFHVNQDLRRTPSKGKEHSLPSWTESSVSTWSGQVALMTSYG
ncbi:growth hormone secretagogue receptor a [Pristis pectinata]|uniref:growth hormone secretagogue receptor a n=1 Tax=Pristis pectinata TaxID=685728 RepID=UPI00223DE44C|nr:growth hormone secretagogue receptor a [Pristis pectinata]